jgi:hypothetical protein
MKKFRESYRNGTSSNLFIPKLVCKLIQTPCSEKLAYDDMMFVFIRRKHPSPQSCNSERITDWACVTNGKTLDVIYKGLGGSKHYADHLWQGGKDDLAVRLKVI